MYESQVRRLQNQIRAEEGGEEADDARFGEFVGAYHALMLRRETGQGAAVATLLEGFYEALAGLLATSDLPLTTHY